MKFGISTCTYTWNFGVEGYPFPETPFTAKELLETAHSHGVGLVQILDNIISLDVYTNAQLDSIAETARRLGIELEIGTLGITPRRLGQYLEIAGRLDAGAHYHGRRRQASDRRTRRDMDPGDASRLSWRGRCNCD